MACNLIRLLLLKFYNYVIHVSNDWIRIRDGGNDTAPIIGNRWCGDKCELDGCLERLTSTTNELYLHFHSRADTYSHSEQNGFMGFRIEVNFELGTKIL